MKNKFKKRLVVLAIVGIAIYFGYDYVLHGGERDIANETIDFEISSNEITSEFTNNIEASNAKYLEKVVAITGKVTSVNSKEVIIDNVVIGNLLAPDVNIAKNKNATIKGRIVGYDDLLAELKLDKCLIIKNK